MKNLLVFGEKTFKIAVPDDSVISFGPFSPPGNADKFGRTTGFNPVGTLRIYGKTKATILACFSNVTGFRDLSLSYAEEVAVEEGASIWKSDQEGYVREDKVQRRNEWVQPALPPAPTAERKRTTTKRKK